MGAPQDPAGLGDLAKALKRIERLEGLLFAAWNETDCTRIAAVRVGRRYRAWLLRAVYLNLITAALAAAGWLL